jgi:hypothetical protein
MKGIGNPTNRAQIEGGSAIRNCTMLLQIGIDRAAIPSLLVWPVRVGAIATPILVSGGFFAVAHRRSLHIILYTGAVLVAVTTLTVGVGLIRSR